MNDYYAELYASGLSHVQAGWRHPFEQAARFALIRALSPQGTPDTLLDIGCGPGDLFGYLREVEWFGQATPSACYLGVDRLEEAVSTARGRWPEARFVCADVSSTDFSHTASSVVAIGAMISGEPCSPAERLRRVGGFVASCIRCSTQQGMIVMLEEGGLQARASLGLEPALFGIRRGEELAALTSWLASQFDVHVTAHPHGLRSDVTLYWQHQGSAFQPPRILDNHAIAAEVFTRLDPEAKQLYWRGWLYVELGLFEEAVCELERSVRAERTLPRERERARLLLAHLRS